MNTTLKNIDLTEAYGFDMVPRGTKVENPYQIQTSQDAYQLCKKLFTELSELREEFYAIYLDRANQVKGILQVSIGGITGTVVDSRIVMKYALDCLACGLILTHNHPSGTTKPSVNDNVLTQKIKEMGKIHDILLLDHIIMGRNAYYSYADEAKL